MFDVEIYQKYVGQSLTNMPFVGIKMMGTYEDVTWATLAAINNYQKWRWFIPPIKMVMTWGWIMALGLPHYVIYAICWANPIYGGYYMLLLSAIFL